MIDREIYEKGLGVTFTLTAILVFIGSWIYCIATYGFLFGVGLGWLPSAIVAVIAGLAAGFLWPLIALGILLFLPSVLLTGCVTTPQYQVAPPSVSQVQGGCFTSREKFLDQTSCIENGISSYSYVQPNPFTQEYIAYMRSLSTKVKASQLSEDGARVQLTQRLNDLRQRQNSEFVQQQALANQRAAKTYEILQQNKLPSLEVHKMPGLSTPVNTTCQVYGNQVNCTSR